MLEQTPAIDWMKASRDLYLAAKRVIEDRGKDHEQCGCDEIFDCDIACLKKAVEKMEPWI